MTASTGVRRNAWKPSLAHATTEIPIQGCDDMTGESDTRKSTLGQDRTRTTSRRGYLKYLIGAAAAAIFAGVGYSAIKYTETGTSASETTHLQERSRRSVILSGSQTPSTVHTLLVEPDDGRTALLNAIQNARESVSLTIYALDDPEINAALIAAHRRGVNVRVLYNYYSFAAEGVKDPNQQMVDAFTLADIQTKRANESFAVTHQKTFSIDGSTAIIMTFNLQPDYFKTTRDFAIITIDPAEVAEVQRVFEADWNYQQIVPTLPELVWSPVNSRQKILNLINSTSKTLDVYNEEVEDQECIEALISAAKRQVAVRLISAELMREGHDTNAPVREVLNNNGVRAIAGTFLYIHAKMILADYGTERQAAFLGSENFSSTSLDKNRELGILVSEQTILDQLHSVFQQDWVKQTSTNA